MTLGAAAYGGVALGGLMPTVAAAVSAPAGRLIATIAATSRIIATVSATAVDESVSTRIIGAIP